MQFSKKDLFSSLVTGFYTGIIIWQILNFLEAPSFGLPGAHPHLLFVFIVPVLWIIGVNLGYFLGRWVAFFNQFGKFAAIGFTNAAVDFGILNYFIALSGETAGLMYSGFKAVSFIAATLHSYFWNKYWAFDAGASQGGGGEFLKFFSVALMALVINVAVASLVVNFIPPVLDLDNKVWANVGAVAGSAAALLFSFAGFKFVVFRR